MPTPKHWVIAPSVLILALIALAWFVTCWWQQVHASNLNDLVQAYEAVLNGTPHWRAFQNRLMGPYLVSALGNISASPYEFFALSTSLMMSHIIKTKITKRHPETSINSANGECGCKKTCVIA